MKKLNLIYACVAFATAVTITQSCTKIDEVIPAESIEKQANAEANRKILPIETVSGFIKLGYKDGALKIAEFRALIALDVCKNGEFFTGSLDGIRKVTKSEVQKLDFKGLPENYEILNLLIDQFDDIYLNTYDRILKIANGKVSNFDPDLYDIFSLCRGADGYIYASGYSVKKNTNVKRKYNLDGTYKDLPIDLGRIQAVTKEGTVYTNFDSKIYKYTQEGGNVIFAGGTRGYTDGTGTQAQFNGVESMTLDNNGNIYASDKNNYRIRKITPEGVVTTVAGNGMLQGPEDYKNDPEKLGDVTDIVYGNGYLYFTEIQPARIRRVKVN